jgi:hypothetical protein
MPSAWLVTRKTKRRGRVYRVHYRLGGAGTQTLYAGTFGRNKTPRPGSDGCSVSSPRCEFPTFASPAGATLREAAARWQASRVDVSAGTGQTYMVALNLLLPRLGDLPLREIQPKTVAALVADLPHGRVEAPDDPQDRVGPGHGVRP